MKEQCDVYDDIMLHGYDPVVINVKPDGTIIEKAVDAAGNYI